jgi:hypothetical protein
MAVRHFSYLDIPIEKRKLAARHVREQVRDALKNPFLAADQKALFAYQLERITRWEAGGLEIGASFVVASLLPKAE